MTINIPDCFFVYTNTKYVISGDKMSASLINNRNEIRKLLKKI